MQRQEAFTVLKGLYLAASIVAAVVMAIVGAAAALVAGAYSMTMTAIILGFSLLLGAKAATNYRRWRAGSVFFVIDQSVRLNLPLPHVIEATARGEGYWLRDRLRTLNEHLVNGAPLAEALRLSVPGLPDSALQQVRAGEAVGQVPRAVRRVTAQLRADMRRNPPSELFNWGYPLMIVMVMCITLGAVNVVIVPRFVRIFEDFEIDLPWMTQVTVYVSRHFGWLVLALASVATFAVMCWAMWRLFVTPSGRRRAFPGRGVLDAIVWRVPALRGFSAGRELGEACLVAADGIDAGVPLHAALRHAAAVPGNAALRRRMMRWAALAEEGRTADDAARGARMPGLLVGMIATAHATPVIADALRFIGVYYAERTSRLAELVRSMAAPLVVIVVALLVGWVIVSLFLPLVELIRGTVEVTL